MIVPFPNPGGEAALKFIVLTPYAPWKEATDAIMDAFPVKRDYSGYFGSSSPTPPRSQPLRPVHRVGA